MIRLIMEVFFYMAKKGVKHKSYDLKLKEKVVKKFMSGISAARLGKTYDIPRHTVESWVHKYRKEGTLVPKPKGRPRGRTDYKEKYEILKKFQTFLKEVEQEKK